ncbi:RND transporter [bacterium]|nr:MAG: RND transporter [bacterium]
MNFKKPWVYPLLASLTLGLAPFTPEPHIWKQMAAIWHGTLHEWIDWFDLVLHGFPWIWLLAVLMTMLKNKNSDKA